MEIRKAVSQAKKMQVPDTLRHLNKTPFKLEIPNHKLK